MAAQAQVEGRDQAAGRDVVGDQVVGQREPLAVDGGLLLA